VHAHISKRRASDPGMKTRGSRLEVYTGQALQTAGRLQRGDLTMSISGAIVSVLAHEAAKRKYDALVAILPSIDPVPKYGSRLEVCHGKALMTPAGLTRSNLTLGCRGSVVSLKASKLAKERWLASAPVKIGPFAGIPIREVFRTQRAPPFPKTVCRDAHDSQ
jgi:hypothetical protein